MAHDLGGRELGGGTNGYAPCNWVHRQHTCRLDNGTTIAQVILGGMRERNLAHQLTLEPPARSRRAVPAIAE
jgi:hypothetical protein